MAVRMWNQLSTTDFLDLDRDKTLILMPIGATEQHGPHLPVGTDHLLVEEVLRRVKPRLQDLEALILPALWCSKSNEHHDFAGSLYLQAETMMAVLHDMAAAIRRSGFKKLVMMNWHGGNTELLGVLARDIRQRCRLTVFVIDVRHSFKQPAPGPQAPPQDFDIHAGRFETSLMLAGYPELVKPGPYDGLGSDMTRGRLARNFSGDPLLLPEDGPVLVGWETTDLTGDGVIGNPAGANAEEGERELNRMADRVEELLRAIASFAYQEKS